MSKYHSRKITWDGIKFDSRKEYQRYCELLLLEKAGKISDLQMQVKFLLLPAQYETLPRYGKNGKQLKGRKKLIEREVSYIADFVYKLNGETVVEDVKGYKGGSAYSIFALKRKLMLHVHGIRIRET